MTKRKKPEARKEEIISLALRLAEKDHYLKVERITLAEQLGIAASSIRYHFGTMHALRREIMRAAIKQNNLQVIAQGLSANDEQALKSGYTLRVLKNAEFARRLG